MTKTEYWSVLQKAIETYGLQAQSMQAMEELSELGIALCKWWRGEGVGQPLYNGKSADELWADIVDELADVSIMIDEMIIGFNCSKDVNERIQYKAARLSDRMKHP